jgi:DNA gyrase inhibitor GyrI
MSDDTTTLSISIKELPSVHVAYIEYKVGSEQGDMHNEIGECFRRVQAWVRERGGDPFSLLNVGALNRLGGQLSSYECCVQVSEQVQSGSDGVKIKELPGGRYAVASIAKDPSIIGPSIGRFHQEYVPQHNLAMDGTRPTYEIYYEKTMEYCVPIL